MRILINGYLTGGNTPPFVKRGKELGYNVKIIYPFNWDKHVLSEEISKYDVIDLQYGFFEKYLIKILKKLKIRFWEYIIIKKVESQIKIFNPDIIWNHQAFEHTKIMLDSNDIIQITSIYGAEIKKLNEEMFSYIAKKSKYLLTTTKVMKDEILNKIKIDTNKIKIFQWGLNNEKILLNIKALDKDQLRIKYGFNVKDKIIIDTRGLRGFDTNVLNLIESINLLSKEDENIKLILTAGYIGRSDVINEVEQYIIRENITNVITIYKNVLEKNEYYELVHLSDVFVSLLPTDQFGVSIIEAAYLEKKLLLSDLKVYKDFFTVNANYLDDISSLSIFNKIRTILHSEYLVDSKTNIENIFKQYSWEKNTEELFSFFKNITLENK